MKRKVNAKQFIDWELVIKHKNKIIENLERENIELKRDWIITKINK